MELVGPIESLSKGLPTLEGLLETLTLSLE